MVKAICELCGAEFSGEKTSRFCSRSCYDKSRVVPEVTCIICFKVFRPRSITQSAKYCSRNCYLIQHGIENEVECPQCGKTFYRQTKKTKFCSRACNATYYHNSEQRGTGYTREVACVTCGKKFLRGEISNKYCSHECYTQGNTGRNNHKFTGYITRDAVGYKRYTTTHPVHPNKGEHHVVWFEKNPDGVCSRCGGTATVVHHKNGIKDDNRLENLDGLCMRCHAIVHKLGTSRKKLSNNSHPYGWLFI